MKLGGRVGAGFYAKYPNNPKQAFLHHGIYSTGFQVKVLAFSEVAKNLLLEKMHNQTVVALGDSQAAIKTLFKNRFRTGVKGGESSSQFRWFTIAKIEL